MNRVRIAIAQINPCVGDLNGNAKQIMGAAQCAHNMGADIVVMPELALTGYPAQDLLLRSSFVRQQQAVLDVLRHDLATLTGLHVVLGHVETAGAFAALYNSASVLIEGRVRGVYRKHELPNYGIFDEKRYFIAGDAPLILDIKGMRFAVAICEDIWFQHVPTTVAQAHAQVLLVLNASPYNMGKQAERLRIGAACACLSGCTLIYANLVGGQDELVFDGASFILDAHGQLCARLPDFETCIQTFDVDSCAHVHRVHQESEERAHSVHGTRPLNIPTHEAYPASVSMNVTRWVSVSQIPERPILEQVWHALVLSVRDYFAKNGFRGALVGLSGGIDSALVLTIAVEALGAVNVRAVMMPSRYTANISQEDAYTLAQCLGVRYDTIAIQTVVDTFGALLTPYFEGQPAEVTEENIQARVRGVLLMALSNQTGALVLATGNKSELSAGYCTLYGDMVGGFAVLKDVPKTLVYALAHWYNQQGVRIPVRILTRPPSAELRPNQRDQDSLPPYDVLDGILEQYMVHNAALADIVAAGFSATTVSQLVQRHQRNEYKRQQAPMGPRITARAFGRDWRYPITNGFQEIF